MQKLCVVMEMMCNLIKYLLIPVNTFFNIYAIVSLIAEHFTMYQF